RRRRVSTHARSGAGRSGGARHRRQALVYGRRSTGDDQVARRSPWILADEHGRVVDRTTTARRADAARREVRRAVPAPTPASGTRSLLRTTGLADLALLAALGRLGFAVDRPRRDLAVTHAPLPALGPGERGETKDRRSNDEHLEHSRPPLVTAIRSRRFHRSVRKSTDRKLIR